MITKSLPQETSCNTCRCWHCPQEGGEFGECRSAPPGIGGWPKTNGTDWCVTGWVEDTRQKEPDGIVQRRQEMGQVGLNYEYIRDYPDDACTWLECILEAPEKIPDAVRHIIANPLGNLTTKMLPLIEDDDIDDCDKLLNWAMSEPGGDNPQVGDASGIFCYLDAPEEQKRNSEALSSLGDDHPFVVMVKKIK